MAEWLTLPSAWHFCSNTTFSRKPTLATKSVIVPFPALHTFPCFLSSDSIYHFIIHCNTPLPQYKKVMFTILQHQPHVVILSAYLFCLGCPVLS
jgi:hypothetical protein